MAGKRRVRDPEKRQQRNLDFQRSFEAQGRRKFKWGRCKVCGRKIALDNNAERKIDPPRKLGVLCCPWCSERSVELYKIVRDLVEAMKDEDSSDLWKVTERARELLNAGS